MKHIYQLLTLLLVSNIAAFGQSAPATNYMNLGGSNVNVGVGFTNASGVYPRYPLSFPNVVGDKISLWNTNPTAPNGPHYGLGVQGARFQLFAPASSDNIVFGIGSSANFTENVRFTGDGKVGIGTDSPTFAGFVVDKRIGATNAIFGSNTTGVAIESNFPGISLNGYWNNGRKAIASGFVGGMGFNPTTGTLSLYTSFSSASAANAPVTTPDRLVVLANGNVGIGTATPFRKLDVSGNTRIVGDGSVASLEVLGGVKLLTGDQGQGKILTSDADGDASWQKAGYGAVSLTVTPGYVISSTVIDGITVLDDDARYNPATDTYTVGQAGYYMIAGRVSLDFGGYLLNGSYKIQVAVNGNAVCFGTSGVDVIELDINNQAKYKYAYPANINTVIKCNAGDLIVLSVKKVSGSYTNISDGQFTITKL